MIFYMKLLSHCLTHYNSTYIGKTLTIMGWECSHICKYITMNPCYPFINSFIALIPFLIVFLFKRVIMLKCYINWRVTNEDVLSDWYAIFERLWSIQKYQHLQTTQIATFDPDILCSNDSLSYETDPMKFAHCLCLHDWNLAILDYINFPVGLSGSYSLKSTITRLQKNFRKSHSLDELIIIVFITVIQSYAYVGKRI